MAQKVQVILVDDIEGGQADETVKFSLDGVNYEIDLNEGNAEQFRDNVLGPWVDKARRVGGRKISTPPRQRRGPVAVGTKAKSANRYQPTPEQQATYDRLKAEQAPKVEEPKQEAKVIHLPPDNATLRRFAEDNNLKCSPRGRVPQSVIDAYAAAH